MGIVLLVTACAAVPPIVQAEAARTGKQKPGAATVVFFTDFQCPYCRRTHAALAPMVDARAAKVRVVLVHVPLPRHPDARTAARAAICVETITSALTTDYAHALFEAQDLSEAACEDLAVERGVDRDRFRECLASPVPEARLARDLAAYDAARGDGVPLLYIGKERIDGAPPPAILEAALDEAIGR